ncbi:MAG: hypothetical protein PHD55_07420 [Methanoregula sp.]|nr:hypothetical protein [Methanoregula sp.]
MTDAPSPAGNRTAGSMLSGIFGGFLGIAVALALALLLFPSNQYLAVSNYLQILAAFSGAIVFCWYYLRHEAGSGFLWAAAGFALWGIANAAWYVAAMFGIGSSPFPGPVDLGFVVVLLILASAYKRIYPRKRANGLVLLGLLVLMLILPLAILVTSGVTDQSLMILLYFFACGLLLITALNYSFTEHPAALAGTVVLVLAYLAYPIREAFFAANTASTVIGPLVAAGFSLIVIGLLPDGSKPQASPTSPDTPE